MALALGIAVVAWLVARSNPAVLLQVVPTVGWGFAMIVAMRAVTIMFDTGAWRFVFPRESRPRYLVLLPLRWIGEAVNTVLPAAQIGGEFIRARLLTNKTGHGSGADRSEAQISAAYVSVVADFLLSLFAQVVFTIFGLILLTLHEGARRSGAEMVGGAALLIAAVAIWRSVATGGLLRRIEGVAIAWRRQGLAARLQGFNLALSGVARAQGPILTALCLHAASWFGHAAETWLTLRLMAAPTSFANAILLESLSLAARSAAFLIPGGLGAQEATLVALAAVTGLSPETALGLGLVKRLRELAVGLPGLGAWALIESGRAGGVTWGQAGANKP